MPRNGSYLRADFPWRAPCPTCGEPLVLLRWGHEERCEAFAARRRARLNRIGLVLLVLSLALMLVHR